MLHTTSQSVSAHIAVRRGRIQQIIWFRYAEQGGNIFLLGLLPQHLCANYDALRAMERSESCVVCAHGDCA